MRDAAPPATRRLSLTLRVVLAVTATVAVFVGLQSLLAYFALHTQEDSLTNDLLRHEVQQLVQLTLAPGEMPVGSLKSSQNITAYLTRGNDGRRQLPDELVGLAPGFYELEPKGKVWHVAIVDTEDGRLTVLVDATGSEQRVYRFGFILLALWCACVAATALIARSVAAIAVGPMVKATSAIARWLPERPDAPRHPRDEARSLIETFNRFRDQADEAFARERELTANLDHEIRTPLTTIRTDAELIAVGHRLPAAEAQRLQRIVASVDDIAATIALALSTSAGKPVALESIALIEALHAACDAYADRAAQSRLRIDLDVSATARVVADRQALLTVFRNIVRNALEHAAPAHLTIVGDDTALRFTDTGPGIDAGSLAFVFDRYRRSARRDTGTTGISGETPRRGLGLAIARRLCDLHGWELSAHSPVANGYGTSFRIAFAQTGDPAPA